MTHGMPVVRIRDMDVIDARIKTCRHLGRQGFRINECHLGHRYGTTALRPFFRH